MTDRNVFKRACDLARSGHHRGLSTIERALREEGFTRGQIEEHFFGLSARKTIRELCKTASLETAECRRDLDEGLSEPA